MRPAAQPQLIPAQQIHRLRSSPKLAGNHEQPPDSGMVLRKDFGMDTRLSPVLRLLRMGALAGSESSGPSDGEGVQLGVR